MLIALNESRTKWDDPKVLLSGSPGAALRSPARKSRNHTSQGSRPNVRKLDGNNDTFPLTSSGTVRSNDVVYPLSF